MNEICAFKLGNLNILDCPLMKPEEHHAGKSGLSFDTEGAKEMSVKSLNGCPCSSMQVEDAELFTR